MKNLEERDEPENHIGKPAAFGSSSATIRTTIIISALQHYPYHPFV